MLRQQAEAGVLVLTFARMGSSLAQEGEEWWTPRTHCCSQAAASQPSAEDETCTIAGLKAEAYLLGLLTLTSTALDCGLAVAGGAKPLLQHCVSPLNCSSKVYRSEARGGVQLMIMTMM